LLQFGVERLRQYATMIHWNVQENLKATYPLTMKVLGENGPAVLEGFFLAHPATSFRLMQNAEPFSAYLEAQSLVQAHCPFLPELARYEWIRASLYNAADPEEINLAETIPQETQEMKDWYPVLNPVALKLPLTYPIHRIAGLLSSGEEVVLDTQTPGQTLLWMYRHPITLTSQEKEVSPMLADWLQTVLSEQHSGSAKSYLASLTALAERHQIPSADTERFCRQFLQAIPELQHCGIMLGSHCVKA
jgi:hypothetical protein